MVTRACSNAHIGGFTAHATFPPPPKSEAAKYQAAALYRINKLAAKYSGEDGTSTMNQEAQRSSTERKSQPTTPERSPIRISFRKPQTSIKARSYRNKESNHEESEEEQYLHSLKIIEGRKPTAISSTNTKSPRKFAACLRKGDEQSSKPNTYSDPPINPGTTSPQNLHLSVSKCQPAKPLSTVTGAAICTNPVPPIWPAIKLQDGWDSLTGFPSGSFVFSTNKAFPRIVGPIIQGFGEVIGRVNHMFPLLRLRWERTPMKADGRRDLAVWVEFGFGVSRTDPDALAQKQVMIEGLQDFHHRDLAGSQDYFGTYFEKNIERLRTEVRTSSADTTSMRRR